MAGAASASRSGRGPIAGTLDGTAPSRDAHSAATVAPDRPPELEYRGERRLPARPHLGSHISRDLLTPKRTSEPRCLPRHLILVADVPPQGRHHVQQDALLAIRSHGEAPRGGSSVGRATTPVRQYQR